MPSVSADDSDSTSPSNAFTSVWLDRATYASTCSPSRASAATRPARARRSPTAPASDWRNCPWKGVFAPVSSVRTSPGRPAHGHGRHPEGGLAGGDGDALAVLAAGAGPGVEVVADRVDRAQDLGTVADEVGGP